MPTGSSAFFVSLPSRFLAKESQISKELNSLQKSLVAYSQLKGGYNSTTFALLEPDRKRANCRACQVVRVLTIEVVAPYIPKYKRILQYP